MATRTRQEYLKDLAKNYVTATTVETGQKFCKLRNNNYVYAFLYISLEDFHSLGNLQ